MKFIVAMLVAVLAGLAFTLNAMATEVPDKVFVCKYVGTPGVDETLQTGQNPISVSINAIPEGVGVGGSFADAQGRSLVIAFDTGQGAPSCPDGQGCEENCPPPPTDVCTNIEGVQTEVPEGFHAAEDENGRPICIEDTPPPTDVCPNLEGVQTTVPPGFTLINGECVPVVINPQCAPPQVFNPLTGLCEAPGTPPTPPGPPHEVRGLAAVFCDSGAKLYRITGTIDGFTVDSATPATIPGNVRGVSLVTLKRGDTSFRTSVFTMGDCDTTVAPVPPVFTPPVVTAKPPAAVVTPKPKPKPVRKPVTKKKKVIVHKAKPKPKKPTVHICKPVNGQKRVWVKSGPDKGCQYVGKPEPSHLTG